MEALRRALRETPELVRDHVSQAVALSTFSLTQRIRAAVPVKTGTLKGAISSSTTPRTGKVTIGADAHYWRYLEYGRQGVAAYPFVRPAGEIEAAEFERRILNIGRQIEASWSRVA